MKFSAKLHTGIYVFLLFLIVFFFKLPHLVLADWKFFEPTFEYKENEEINARAVESRDTTGKTTEIFSSRLTSDHLNNIFYSGIVAIGGRSEKAIESGYFDKRETAGAIGVLAQAIGTIYASPPASGFAYVSDALVNAGLLAKPAYAQGIGFAGLTPLLSLWKTARNISYSILIIIMVVVGFMIIFRAKIDPKTVISVQSALPRIILTLILITFSYAIAGFMIDLMYLAMAVLINLLSTGITPDKLPPGLEDITKPALQQTEFITGGWAKLWGSVFNFKLFIPFVTQGLMSSAVNSGGLGFATLLGGIVAKILAANALGIGLGAAVPALLILLIIFLGLLFTVIRITFLLINSYIQVLVAVILAPLLLLKEAIPGQSAFKEWLQNLIANLVVFPATVGVIYGSWIFTAVTWKGNLWGAPLIPVGGGGSDNGNPLAIFMGLGVIFLAPNLIASVKKAFHPKPALPITAGSAFSPVTGAAQTSMGAMSQFYYMKQIAGGDERTGSRGAFAPVADLFRKFLGK